MRRKYFILFIAKMFESLELNIQDFLGVETNKRGF